MSYSKRKGFEGIANSLMFPCFRFEGIAFRFEGIANSLMFPCFRSEGIAFRFEGVANSLMFLCFRFWLEKHGKSVFVRVQQQQNRWFSEQGMCDPCQSSLASLIFTV